MLRGLDIAGERAIVAGMFCRHVLRTTDPPAARAFYAAALGVELPDARIQLFASASWHVRALRSVWRSCREPAPPRRPCPA